MRLRTLAGRLAPLVAFGPLRLYRAGLAGLIRLAKGTASVLSSGSLRQDLRIVLAATVVLVAPLLLTRAVLGAPDAGDVILDLSECEWIDGAGLRMLAVATVLAHRSGLHVYVRGCTANVRRLLRTARLRPLIDLEPLPVGA